MTKRKKKIPQKIEAEILFNNDRTCCICKDSKKGIQIHHIDGDPNNNDLSNLAVVCMEHHDEIHKTRGVTKGFPPLLLKKYKRNWELTVRKRRTEQHKPLKSKYGFEKILFEFEIRKIAYEIVSLNDDNIDGINQRLDFLHSLYLLEGYTDKILRNLDHVVILPALSDENKASIIAEKIHHFFFHLATPDTVKIKKKDKENLKLAIGMIGTIGGFSAEFNRSKKIIINILISYEYFWDVLIWYDLEDYALMILDELDDILSACESKFEDEKTFIFGIKAITKFRKGIKSMTNKASPKWKKVLTRLNK